MIGTFNRLIVMIFAPPLGPCPEKHSISGTRFPWCTQPMITGILR